MGRDDPDVLLASGELLSAARALCRRGRHSEAAEVFERIYMDVEAARCKAHDGDLVGSHRYLLHARRWAEAAELLEGVRDEASVLRDCLLRDMAVSLAEAGRSADAAPVLESLGDLKGAATAYLDAGDQRAAARLEAVRGRPLEAARLLEAWLESAKAGGLTGSKEWAEACMDQARALLRAGRLERSVAVVQGTLRGRESMDDATCRQALIVLLRALSSLGWEGAAEEVWAIFRSTRASRHSDYRSWLCEQEIDREETDEGDEGARVLAGRYRLLELLGSGAVGQVHKGVDEVSGREVAIKVLMADQSEGGGLERFFREARVAASLDHPGLVRVLEATPDRGLIVMEFLAGGTLEEKLRGGRRLPVGFVRRVGLALCDALGALHRRGVLHRDIKPENILFDDLARPRLADLGAAHLVSFRQTASGFLLGSLAYMAPEQILGERLSSATDVFGLAVTLYRAVTGRLPFPGPEVSEQHRAGALPPSRLIEEEREDWWAVDETFALALCPSPEERLRDVQALADSLERWPSSKGEQELHGSGGILEPLAIEAQKGEKSAPTVGNERYEVLLRLGARVSLARDHVLQRAVVLESLPDAGRAEWLERVSALAAARNRSLQAVLDVEFEQGLIVWQWLDGEGLHVFGAKPRGLEDALRVGADVARALVDHPGDVEPRRVLVSRGRAAIALAGSDALRDGRPPPDDARPSVACAVGRILHGEQADTSVLDEVAPEGQPAPADPAELSAWLTGILVSSLQGGRASR